MLDLKKLKGNKKGITSEVLVIILLIIALTIMIVMFLAWGGKGKSLGIGLSNLSTTLLGNN